MTPIDLSSYRYDAPLLVEQEKLVLLSSDEWQTGNALISILASHPPGIRGIILPLELESDAHDQQDLFGVELLNWARWSLEDPLRLMPILTFAGQPLAKVLQRTLNLLLVGAGTKFVQFKAKEQPQTFLDEFIHAVRTSDLRADPDELERIAAGGNLAQQISYHDLANDYYSASRLWAGYKHALTEAQSRFPKDIAIHNELDRIDIAQLPWLHDKVETRLRQPHVRQFLASARARPGTPFYPAVPKANETILAHASRGLPQGTRILLVDDEFDKGLADVLLQVLFRKSDFSSKKDSGDEWIYSECQNGDPRKPWVRMVCVKTADAAAHWLSCWGEIESLEQTWQFQMDKRAWLEAWAATLGKSMVQEDDCREVFGSPDHPVDCPTAYPKGVNTVVLLDLRLDPQEGYETSDLGSLKSIKLRKLIKQHEKSVPVIMVTASRQAMTYAVVMDDAAKADGWLTKEGPDTTPDDANSARAVLYLLRQLHFFASLKEWYREDMQWKLEWKEKYDEWRCSPNWNTRQIQVERVASQLLASIQNKEFRDRHESARGLEWMDAELAECSSVEKILIKRLVLLAALLLTADYSNQLLKCNADNFNNILPGKDERRISTKGTLRNIRYVSEVINIGRDDFWFHSMKPDRMIETLVDEDHRWLLQRFPAATYPQIHRYIEHRITRSADQTNQ